MAAKLFSVVSDMTKPYTAIESWGYDRFIAPAVITMAADVVRELADAIGQTGEILDVGCGGGQLLSWVAERYPEAHLTGVDLSAEQVARARVRTAKYGERVQVREGSALALPFKTGSFDAVISVASIKHWPHPEKGMQEIVRVLRPGGVLYVAEVDRGCKFEDAARFVDLWRLPSPVRRMVFPLFRTYVAGQGIDLEDARSLLKNLKIPETAARRLPRMPAVLMAGVKPKRKSK